MRYSVYDSETTIRNRGEHAIGTMEANPFYPDNFVVAYGELAIAGGQEQVRLEYDVDGHLPVPFALATPDPLLLIGHNLPFDLQYMWKMWEPDFWRKLPTLYLWDTQQADYLLSGQDHMFPSLDEVSASYGLPLKPDAVKEYWKQGIDTPLIPKDLLLEYLGSADIHNPLAIFRRQWEEFQKRPKLFKLFKLKMDDLMLTTIMAIHGMQFDLVKAQQKIEALDARMQELEATLKEQAQGFFEEPFEFNPGSTDHISLAAWGGEYKVIRDLPVLTESGEPYRYKTGQRKGEVKTKKTEVKLTTKGFGLSTGIAPQNKNGLYSSEEEYLAKHAGHPFIDAVMEYRTLDKDVSTYYRGYSQLVFPDGRLHPQYNHSSVVTGRMSAEKPNLQNVTRDDD